MSFTPPLGHHGPWVQQQRKMRARPHARTSPPPSSPVFEISTRNRFAPIRETERDAVIVGDFIVRHVHATLAEGKMHTLFPWRSCSRCFRADARDPEGRRGHQRDRAAHGSERHQAAADGDTEEGLQEPDRDGAQHITRGNDHHVWTASHVLTRTRKLFRADGLHPSRVGAELLSDNISRTLRSI